MPSTKRPFAAIDALLASAPDPAPLPPAERRRQLRDEVGLSRAEVARALGVSPSTLGGWEAGRDPSGETREQYAYFLRQAEEKIRARAAVAAEPPAEAGPPAPPAQEADGNEDQAELAEPQPCVLCGQPARHEVAGYPQHLDPAECSAAVTTVTTAPASAPTPTTAAAEEPPALRRRPARRGSGGGVRVAPVGRRVRPADTPDRIAQAVAAVLAEHSGDVEAATAALVKRAIPDAMVLLDHSRKGGRYDIVAHPWLPDILRKKSARGADEIWEARPKWTRPELPAGEHEVTALDINGAYLSALKTWLPLGQLEHSTGNQHDRRRSGFHLITPPEWEHGAVLPNPIGARDEPGPVWVGEPTLRQLLRISAPKYGLCDPPVIHESWTSGATETLLEKFRITLKDARDKAIAEGDDVTLEYVKAMYSKFVSTLGESNYNREIYRQDWMHLIRSQAFANLWMKAFKAYDEGLTVVRAMGTDELHVIGDWRAVFTEGRGVTEVKVKDTYSVSAGT
ncbi:helix-turn-helix domain-containing protein [Streptomyces tricolor]|uniref:Helix-turn-helix domain-containing protein n=1 Tax=Streptomyces tricolor TaxID=68277 RepID=A0ABS9JSE8_9ACTN|nr:helix-turn-helix transcriptional regulator [Streptomyces tricolor]MCG0068453.1 helix-turn-helix domain-containing protein [Streptomyces tricolor]